MNFYLQLNINSPWKANGKTTTLLHFLDSLFPLEDAMEWKTMWKNQK